MKNEPYERLEYSVYTCARKETAEYLRDWCEAVEHDRVLTYAKENGLSEIWIKLSHKNVFSIEESEVIL